ncbi:hypothetical protein GOP47_0010772 [Adiantum capillus-veneris]|uniref:Uncharacterized protein n=1 Tax=Adiantum capillus-veneris TaxID=13818 RepID=A0A9D4UVN2_ADICA|nr:hypothetical protein GOP47_0010772 [Adiantum capillus-veneris]
MAALLTPGILTKLLDKIGCVAKVAGAHRAVFLQVVGIVPAISASDHLSPHHGFYIKVSDSSHCTYMSLAEEHDDLILSNKLQLGQLIQVERLDLGSPVPILRGVQPLPGKQSFFGNPQELHLSDSSDFLHVFNAGKPFGEGKESSKANNLAATGLLGLPSEPACDRRCSLGAKDARVKIDKPAEKNECLKGPEFSSPPVFTSPRNKFLPGRRSGERASWAIVGVPLAEKLEDSQEVRPSRTKVIPEFSPVHSRSVSASPARHHSVRSSLVFNEKDGLLGDDMSHTAAKGSPEVRKLFQKVAISSTTEASSRYRQVSPAFKRAVSVGKVGQRLCAEETKTRSNPLRKSISKGRTGDTISTEMSNKNKTAQRCREDTRLGKSSRCEINNVLAEGETTPLKSMRDVKAGSGVSFAVCSKVDEYISLPSSPSLVAVSDVKSVRLENGGRIISDLLSANLLALGKKAVKRQLTATIAASEALQEASATQAIIQCLSDFAEFCTTARPENPGPVVDKFFAFYNALVDAGKNVCAMAESRLLIDLERKDKEAAFLKRSCRIYNEKNQAAASWVNAALSSGLTACPWANKDQKPLKSPTREGFDGKCCKNKMSSFSSPARMVARPPACPAALPNSINGTQNRSLMSPPPFRALGDEHGFKGNKTPSSKCQSETFQPVDMKELPPSNMLPPERRADLLLAWAKGNGFAETVVLAKELQSEAETWFLRFVESALDSGYKAAIREATVRSRTRHASSPWPDDNNKVSTVLSDLKRVNEWLDEMTCGRRTFPSCELEETTAKLKQKLYNLLIQLVLRSPSQIISNSVGS